MNCPICTLPITDLHPKPRCRNCGYVESCCQPELPCELPPEGVSPVSACVDTRLKATERANSFA